MHLSRAEILAALPEDEREAILAKMSLEDRAQLRYNWKFWARPAQIEPEGDWTTWLVLAGRGFGKTRMGAEWVRSKAENNPNCRIALVGETAADCRKVMIEGDSGILAISSPDFMPEYSPSNRQLVWPNGAMALTYNATQPDQLRGPQHHFAWADEIAKWDLMVDSWDQLQFGLRLGDRPQQIVTTTPRPLPLIRQLVADTSTHTTKGRTMDNVANMPDSFLKYIEDKYGGTRLGRQELEGEILDDIPGALWQRVIIDQCRVREVPDDLQRVIVAVDPATSNEERSDENGIVVVGVARDKDGYARGYVLEDASHKGTPEEWAKTAVRMYRKWSADKIVAEKNQGGLMVESVIRAVDRSLPIKLVNASRGKVVRAEPISALYEQGRIHHVGRHDLLEDQMCLFSVDNVRNSSTGSPDRVDALVWGLTEVFDKITGRRRAPKTDDIVIDKTKPGWDAYLYNDSPNGWMA